MDRNHVAPYPAKVTSTTDKPERKTMASFQTSTGRPVPFWTSCRAHMAAALAVGYLFFYLLRVNLSMAIVCMIREPSVLDVNSTGWTENTTTPVYNLNTTQPNLFDACGSLNGGSARNSSSGEFEWSKTLRGTILSAFFYGYIVTQIPGGWLAGRFGGKHVYGTGMLISIIATMLIPVAARANPFIVVALRVITGLAMGVCFPATHAMWGCWAPPFERAKLVSFSYAGTMLGTILAMAVSGLLCSVDLDNGWPLIFYFYGGAACLWQVWWYFCVFSSPDTHPRISVEEKEYLMSSIGKGVFEKKNESPPWKDILTSKAVWAIVAAHTTNNWGSYTILTSIPMYMKEVLKFDIKASGALSALPYAVMYIITLLAGLLADFIKTRGYLGTTALRKLYSCLASFVPAIFIMAMGFMDCEKRHGAVAMLVITVGFTAFCRAGYSINHVDIAPKYAGILFGLSNTVATIPGLISPIVVGALTPNGTQSEWQKVFFICAAVYSAGAIIFLVLGSGEEQDWAKGNRDPQLEAELESLRLSTRGTKKRKPFYQNVFKFGEKNNRV